MSLKICYLGERHCQNDSNLINILGVTRYNSVDDSHLEELQERIYTEPKNDTNIIKLYTHNVHVDDINTTALGKVSTKTKVYTMTSHGNQTAVESLLKRCIAPEQLVLESGVEVMLVANNPNGTFVNGTLGRVIDFDDEGMPIIKTKDRIIVAQEHTWKTENGPKAIAETTQLPFRLAWAITIHKSQGMSSMPL